MQLDLTKSQMQKYLRYSALYILPFLIMMAGGTALQYLTKNMAPGFTRIAVYSGLTLIIALGIALVVRRSQLALSMKPFNWGKPSSLIWGVFIGMIISAASGVGFGVWEGYPIHLNEIFHNLPMNAFRQTTPALTEEIVFRAGIVHTTVYLFGTVAGLASGSVPFGILHLAGLLFGQSVTAAQIFGISLAGLMLSLVFIRYGILGALGTHLAWNALVSGWIQTYGLTDKAAAVSALEGSWVTCLVLLMACTLLYASKNSQTRSFRSYFWRTEESDVDLSQLDRNLRLTPDQRLVEHQAALSLCEELARAGQKLHEQSQ